MTVPVAVADAMHIVQHKEMMQEQQFIETRIANFENSPSHSLVVPCIYNVVGEVDEKLGKTSLGGGVVAEDGGEGGIAKRLW